MSGLALRTGSKEEEGEEEEEDPTSTTVVVEPCSFVADTETDAAVATAALGLAQPRSEVCCFGVEEEEEDEEEEVFLTGLSSPCSAGLFCRVIVGRWEEREKGRRG